MTTSPRELAIQIEVGNRLRQAMENAPAGHVLRTNALKHHKVEGGCSCHGKTRDDIPTMGSRSADRVTKIEKRKPKEEAIVAIIEDDMDDSVPADVVWNQSSTNADEFAGMAIDSRPTTLGAILDKANASPERRQQIANAQSDFEERRRNRKPYPLRVQEHAVDAGEFADMISPGTLAAIKAQRA